jgi:hypothetical protein
MLIDEQQILRVRLIVEGCTEEFTNGITYMTTQVKQLIPEDHFDIPLTLCSELKRIFILDETGESVRT